MSDESAVDRDSTKFWSTQPTERASVAEISTAPLSGYSQELLIHQLFERQVQRSAREVAVTHQGQTLTYAELNEKSNQLARYLKTKGVSADVPVGVCIERSLEMVVALVAILKAGGAYLPLDPNYPCERLHYMLQDAAPPVVLMQEKLRAVLPEAGSELIDIDGVLRASVREPAHNLSTSECISHPDDLLYIIYTSGSTGRPKGTEMPHRSMVNLIDWHADVFRCIQQRALQFAALSFDVAFQEIFSTLCTGGTLVLLEEWVRRDARALTELLMDERVQRLFVPPLILQSLAEHCAMSGQVPVHLEHVITAGEQLRISAEIVALFGKLIRCRLHNHYGPTETHVVAALTLTGNPAQWPTLPSIGMPISNTQIYILDEWRQPLDSAVGEIYIGGANLARGYHSRPEVTAQRFLADPFKRDARSRVYRTGDLGRWKSDGTIEYLGRNDDQVKIRGYRIELGEVEAQLATHSNVREVAVVAREDDRRQKRLVAYVTARKSDELNAEGLRAHARNVLPDYMVPSAFMIMEHLPVTPSGKLDRRALPLPDPGAQLGRVYEPPRSELERGIASLWQELLAVQTIGRQDDFFELGGDSIIGMRLISALAEKYAVQLQFHALLAHSTLQGIAQIVAAAPSQRRAQLPDDEAELDEGFI